MMSDHNWRKSLRATPCTQKQPKAILRYRRSPTDLFILTGGIIFPTVHNNTTYIFPQEPTPAQNVKRERHSNSNIAQNIPRQGLVKMHPVCCACRKDIDSNMIFTSDCCRRINVCQTCHVITDENIALYTCRNCNEIKTKSEFRLMDTGMEHVPPKCDQCNKIIKLSYMLPCEHKICEECFESKEKILKTVDKSVTGQSCICCEMRECENVLYAIQQVHKISHRPQKSDVLACALCDKHLIGKSTELICGHFTCEWCGGYCGICRKSSYRQRPIDMSKMHIRDIIAKENKWDYESMHVKLCNFQPKCDRHGYKSCVELHCSRKHICIGCIEDMSEKTVSFKTAKDSSLHEYCICSCSTKEKMHIVPLHFLRNVTSKIKYLNVPSYSYCYTLGCTNNSTVMLRDCYHGFCVKHGKNMLGNPGNHTTKCEKIHGKRKFCFCIYEQCKIAVPVDELEQYVLTQTEMETNKVSMIGKPNDTSRPSLDDQSTRQSKSSDFVSIEMVNADAEKSDTRSYETNTGTIKDKMITEEMNLSKMQIGQRAKETGMIEKPEQKAGPTSDKKMKFTTSSSEKSTETLSDTLEDMNMKTNDAELNQANSRTQECKPVTEKNNSTKAKNYLRPKPTGYLCNNEITCTKKPFVEFTDCSHSMCLQCLKKKLTDAKGSDVINCKKCKNEIPVDQLEEYLLKHEPAVCDNPECKAENNMRTEIRHIFPDCEHKLCAECKSAQQTERDKPIYCMVAKCRPSRLYHTQTTADNADPKEILGIPNVGLTCYASCILQVLGQTPFFRDLLDRYCQHSPKIHVDNLLNNLLKNVNLGGDRHFIIDWMLIDQLMQRIFIIDRSFRRYEENDCHSFIMTVLNALKMEDEEIETTGRDMSPREKRRLRNQCRTQQASGEKDKKAAEQDLCPAVLFESRIVSKFFYKPCGHEEAVDDQLFQSILIPVQDDLQTIEQGLHQFFKGQEFSGNVLPCRSCNVQQNTESATRILQFAKAPEVLMLQLGRFEEVQQAAGFYKELRKTNHAVMFEKNLKLRPEQSVDKRELEYELYGVVLHSGNMHGGHYTACVRKLNSGKWFYCSDSSVVEVDEFRIFQEWCLKQAYVLFYGKKH